jgi:hypothetical protein
MRRRIVVCLAGLLGLAVVGVIASAVVPFVWVRNMGGCRSSGTFSLVRDGRRFEIRRKESDRILARGEPREGADRGAALDYSYDVYVRGNPVWRASGFIVVGTPEMHDGTPVQIDDEEIARAVAERMLPTAESLGGWRVDAPLLHPLLQRTNAPPMTMAFPLPASQAVARQSGILWSNLMVDGWHRVRWVALPLAGLWLFFASGVPRWVQGTVRIGRGMCPLCGYSVTDLPGRTCPECGWAPRSRRM